MPARTWALLGTLLVATLAAGCTKGGDDPGSGGTPTPADGGTTPTPGGNATTPDDFTLEDSGAFQGPFQQTWDIPVENVAYTAATIQFELAGVQAGAPPTARVNLQLADPEGNIVKSTTLGVGGSGNSAAWDLTPADTPTPGTYTLSAVSGSDLPLPSGGVATWTLLAQITY